MTAVTLATSLGAATGINFILVVICLISLYQKWHKKEQCAGFKRYLFGAIVVTIGVCLAIFSLLANWQHLTVGAVIGVGIFLIGEFIQGRKY